MEDDLIAGNSLEDPNYVDDWRFSRYNMESTIMYT